VSCPGGVAANTLRNPLTVSAEPCGHQAVLAESLGSLGSLGCALRAGPGRFTVGRQLKLVYLADDDHSRATELSVVVDTMVEE
jgi:hypothetical protein